MKRSIAALCALFFVTAVHAQNSGTVTNHAFAIGKGAGVAGYTSLLCGSAQLAVGQSAANPICQTVSGDLTLSAAGVAALNMAAAHVWTGAQTFSTAGVFLTGAAPVALSGLNQGSLSTSSGGGLVLNGDGSVYDVELQNRGTSHVCGILATTTTFQCQNLTLAAPLPVASGGTGNATGPKSLLSFGGATNAIATNATGWLGSGLQCNGAESFCFLPMAGAATISNLYVNVQQAPGAGQTYTVVLRKNQVNQTTTCVISGAAATSCNDTAHSFNVAAGDNVTVQITTSNGAATIAVSNAGLLVQAQ